MGDVAGIGPEIVARAVVDQRVGACCRPIVVGDPEVLAKAFSVVGVRRAVRVVDLPAPDEWDAASVDCFNPLEPALTQALRRVQPGALEACSGQAAYQCLIAAARAALAEHVDGVVTAPLNKAALHAAGLEYPGHTEILADVCGVSQYAMMLYVPPGAAVGPPHGLGVAHVTLHTSIASVPNLLTTDRVEEKIDLVQVFLCLMGAKAPRIGVCALNPHGGEGGLFGNEEQRIIEPAVERAAARGILVRGPIPADALIRRAIGGEFDGVVAMYHDQGHIPIKLIAPDRAVNVTLGLPIIRTSPSHGTAFDIAWMGVASAEGMVAAIRTAALITNSKNQGANILPKSKRQAVHSGTTPKNE